MNRVLSRDIETMANAFLQVGDRVVEVSRDHVVTKIWDSSVFAPEDKEKYLGKKISEIRNDNIFTEIDKLVTESFKTGDNRYLEYTLANGQFASTYSIRVLATHPDKNFLFAVVKNITKQEGERLVEDKWKLALDSAGDGMWDVNVPSGKIYFSDKWHEIFGYSAAEISTVAEWSAKVHPDDVQKTIELRDSYLSGKTASYTTEVRYLCKDGSYKWILSRGVVVSYTPEGKPLRFIGTHTDINERKTTEEKYATTAQLLSKLINNLQNGIVVTDEHRRIVFANQVYCNMYGITGGPDELVKMSLEEGIEKRKQLYKNPDLFAKRSEEIFSKHEMLLNEEWELTDGRIISRDHIPLMQGDVNKGGIWKFNDITSQRTADRKLQDQRIFYEQVLNSIAADIVVFDADHRYLFLNPVAIKDDELRKWMIGKTDEEYCAYRNKPAYIAERRREIFNTAVNERQPIQWEEKLMNSAGEIEYHLRNMFPVFNDNGALQMMIGYGLNVTDRVKAQEALKTSRDTFESAFDYSGIGMALISPGGKWLDVNNVLCEMTGYSKDELLKLTLADITYPEDLNTEQSLVRKLLTRQISTYNIEKRYVSSKKKIVLVSLTVSVVWNIDDTPKFFIAQVMDITKRKELENEISRKNTELEATKTNLINKVNQLEELSHIIAHNLRGPAANIRMLSGALSANHKGDGPGSENSLSGLFTQDEALGLIEESSSALMDSLSTLMEITEIKLNKEIPYNDCDVKAQVNEIITHLYSTIYEKHAIIKLELQVTCISYPKVYLENILYNFISNALKYSKPDVVPEITVSTTIINDRVRISVKDNGLGIDMEKYGSRVFKLNQVFHQGYDSKGVGLYITKTQVESLGGTIDVSSRVNEGSEFIVTL